MELTNEQIVEIAELLECGLICYFHRPTGKIESHPDPDNLYSDIEVFQDIIDKIESDWDNYDRFEKMDSDQAFKVMWNFALSLNDEKFKNRILELLSRPKPFRHFNALIHSSNYRQVWFDYKRDAYIDWVKAQNEMKK